MINERTYDRLRAWDIAYKGELMTLTPDMLLDHLEYDADELTNANYHVEARALRQMTEVVRDEVENDCKIGWFCWNVSDLGPIRQCMVVITNAA